MQWYTRHCPGKVLILGLLTTGMALPSESASADQYSKRAQLAGYGNYDPCAPCYPCDPCPPGYPTRDRPADVAPQPSVTPDIAPDQDAPQPQAPDTPAFDSSDFAPSPSTVASTGGTGSLSPGMTGDFLFFGQIYPAFGTPTLPLGGDAVGRYKVSSNTSPLPTDRVFAMVNFYNHVQTGSANSFDITAYTLGFEKTFGRCGWNSIEVRFPFADTSDSFATGTGFNDTVQFGDISITLKHLLYRDRCSAWSAGLGITTPTADDFEAGTVSVDNGSVHLQPFIGWLSTPQGCGFTQAFVGFDFDAGSKTYFDSATLASVDVSDQALFFASISQGYWLWTNHCCNGARRSGVAALVELHYTTTLESGEVSTFGTESTATINQDHLNLVPGILLQLGPCTDARVAAAVPLLDNEVGNRAFETELIFQLNQRY